MLRAIAERSTCRSFDSSKPVPREILEQILAAGLNAPTGMNVQPYDFYVVTRASTLSAIAEAAFANLPPPLVGHLPGPGSVFHGAPAAIIVVPTARIKPGNFCVSYDLGIITESLSLAATALGVASGIFGIVGLAPLEALKEALGPDVQAGVTAVGLGYPTADWAPRPRELTTPVRYVE